MPDLFIKRCQRVTVEPTYTKACEARVEGLDLEELMRESAVTFDDWFDALVEAFDRDRTLIMDKLDRAQVISYFNLKDDKDDE